MDPQTSSETLPQSKPLSRKQKRNQKSAMKRKENRQSATKRQSEAFVAAEIRHQETKRRRWDEEVSNQKIVLASDEDSPVEKEEIEKRITHLQAKAVFAKEHVKFLKERQENLGFPWLYQKVKPLDILPDFRKEKEIKPITPEEKDLINRTMEKDGETVVAPGSFVRIANLRRLRQFQDGLPTAEFWIDTVVMDRYLSLLTTHVQERKRVLVFDSSIGTTIVDKNFKDVKAFTEGRNGFRMFDHKLFLFPLCRSNHWTLVSVDFIQRRIRHFEPMSGQPDIAILDKIRLYLNYQVIMRNYSRNILQPLFTHKESLLGLQLQKNSYDCGVFTMMFARSLILDKPMDFQQKHIPLLRQKITMELINDKIDDSF